MHTLVAKPVRWARRRYSEEFKRQAIEVCLQPGVSVAAIALANGLNANSIRDTHPLTMNGLWEQHLGNVVTHPGGYR